MNASQKTFDQAAQICSQYPKRYKRDALDAGVALLIADEIGVSLKTPREVADFVSVIVRFQTSYAINPGNGCWKWTGNTHANTGYGKTWHLNKTALAHRVSWLIHRGPIPADLQVLHRCDNRPCVNPSHLFLGTHQDNMTDMKDKGRVRKPGTGALGSRCGSAKLTESDVIKIRAMRGSSRDVAAKFGVRHTQINNIRSGKTWKHV